MSRAGIPTAEFEVFMAQPAPAKAAREREAVAVKADGLARGKGVIVCSDPRRRRRRSAVMVERSWRSKKVVIEERLDGPELSLLAVTDGTTSSRWRLPATTRQRTTATRAPTPGAWAPTRRRKASMTI